MFSLILIPLFCIASLHALIKLLIKNSKIFFHHWLVGYKAIWYMNFVYNGLRYTEKITEEQYQKWGKFYNFEAQCLLWSCVTDFYLHLVDNKNPILNNLIKNSNKLKMQENYWNRYHLVLSLHLEITLLPKPIFIYLLNKII